MKMQETVVSLLSFSRREANEIAALLKDTSNTAAVDLLSPKVSERMQLALRVYKELLTKDSLKAWGDAVVYKEFLLASEEWKKLLSIIDGILGTEDRRKLWNVWIKANESLRERLNDGGAINPQAYQELVDALESASEKAVVVGGVNAVAEALSEKLNPEFAAIHKEHAKQNMLFEKALDWLSGLKDLRYLIVPDKRFVGLDKISSAVKQDQVRAAILFSWKNGYAVLKIQSDPKKRAENKGKPTIGSLARILWEMHHEKWLVLPDSYQSEDAYKTALIEQARRNPASFRWAD